METNDREDGTLMGTRKRIIMFVVLELVVSICFAMRVDAQIIWSGNKVSSERIPTLDLESEVADDFIATGPITGVSVFGGSWSWLFGSDPDAPATFNVVFYDDGGCIPNSPVGIYIGLTNTEPRISYRLDPLDGFPIYKVSLTVNQAATPGDYLWFSIQGGDHPFGPNQVQWGVELTTPNTLCSPVFRSAYFGFPYWVPVMDVRGWFDARRDSYDVNQQVTYGEPVATERTTWGAVKALYK
jgi:hypothetical protein